MGDRGRRAAGGALTGGRARRTPWGMQYHCSRCHQRITGPAEGAPEHCPRCKAEAGLEPVKATPLPMMLFAVFLGTAVVVSVVGGVVSVVSG